MKMTEFTLISPVDALPISCLMAEPEGEVKGLVLMAGNVCPERVCLRHK